MSEPTPHHDDDFFEAMREQIVATPLPTGRPSAARVVAVGVPVLAIAGAATALTVGGGSSTSRLSPAAHGSAPLAAAAPLPHAHETAFIVRRLRADLAATGQAEVIESTSAGRVRTPASHPEVSFDNWSYTDPESGVSYLRSTGTSGGVDYYTEVTVGTPTNGAMHFTYTTLDPIQHEYAVSSNDGAAAPAESVPVQFQTQQIRQELKSGQVTQDGPATVDGRPAIKLTLPASQGSTTTLYVDPQIDEPLQANMTTGAGSQYPSTNTMSWLPPTATNVAQTELGQTPDGYTQVSSVTLNHELDTTGPLAGN